MVHAASCRNNVIKLSRGIAYLPDGGCIVRKRFFSFVLVLGWSGSAYAVPEFPENCKLQLQANLPFYLDRGHIMVATAVNGHLLHFMVDTGGVYSAISQRAAQAIGLHPSRLGPNAEIKDAAGAEATDFALIDNITFSHFKAGGLRLMVASLPAGEDGVLAPDLLRNFDIEVDFAAQTMTLFKQPRCDDHVVYWTDDFAKIPLNITPQGHIRIPVTVNGQKEKATLDTGSPFTLMGSDFAAQIGANGTSGGKALTLFGGNGGKVSGAGYKLDSLVVGKFEWVGLSVITISHDEGWRSDGAQILIGLDVMHDLHLFIDYKGEQIFVSQR